MPAFSYLHRECKPRHRPTATVGTGQGVTHGGSEGPSVSHCKENRARRVVLSGGQCRDRVPRMVLDRPRQDFCRAGRITASLLPVAQRTHRHVDDLGELGLRQARGRADRLHLDRIDMELARGRVRRARSRPSAERFPAGPRKTCSRAYLQFPMLLFSTARWPPDRLARSSDRPAATRYWPWT